MSKLLFALFALIACAFIGTVSGHGMLWEPVSRSTRWRFNSSAPPNWSDNELYCGGFSNQWNANGGKCGFCGDNWRDPRPRANEYGGKYGEGIVVGRYQTGGVMPVTVKITANHIGNFFFSICNMDLEPESDACFDRYPLRLTNGADRHPIPIAVLGMFNVQLRLPAGLTCKHCILQWVYVTGNTWGWCEDGSGSLGCGPQEQFRSCADISISNNFYGAEEGSVYGEVQENPIDDVPIEVLEDIPSEIFQNNFPDFI